MNIAIAPDRDGSDLKGQTGKLVEERGLIYRDFGLCDYHAVDYHDHVEGMTRATAAQQRQRGCQART